jgi:hypothetical protein
MTEFALQALHRSIAELKSAIDALCRVHGNSSIVARLRNDLDRLVLDTADAAALRSPSGSSQVMANAAATAPSVFQVSDEPYDQSMWGDDYDQEGVGGYHGQSR